MDKLKVIKMLQDIQNDLFATFNGFKLQPIIEQLEAVKAEVRKGD